MFFPQIDKLTQLLETRFVLIAGPCVIENTTAPRQICDFLASICRRYDIPFIFKASYRKANRTRSSSFTGIGDERALEVLSDIRAGCEVPVLTDVHTAIEAPRAAAVADVLQIPAFLCRQTALLHAAGETGKCVNIKKGQFLSPEAMQFAVEKVRETGNDQILVTERGTSFGYQDLIVDFRAVPIMQQFAPVIVDCTHSLQRPNQSSGVTGGQPSMIETIASAAIAVNASGLFIETHPAPSEALSDGANMLPLDRMEDLLRRLVAIREAIVN